MVHPGDVVTLNSGGLPLTVEAVHGHATVLQPQRVTVEVLWLNTHGNLQNATLPLDCLTHTPLEAITQQVRAQTAKLQEALQTNQPGTCFTYSGESFMSVAPIDDLVAAVHVESGVIDSAILLINGFTQRLADGIAAALAGGATAAELAPLVTLKDDVTAKSAALAAAVAANTPTP